MVLDYFQVARVFFIFSFFTKYFPRISVCRICKLYSLFFSTQTELEIIDKYYIHIYIYIILAFESTGFRFQLRDANMSRHTDEF